MTAADLRAWCERRYGRRYAYRTEAAAELGLTLAQLDHRLSGQNRIEAALARLCTMLERHEPIETASSHPPASA